MIPFFGNTEMQVADIDPIKEVHNQTKKIIIQTPHNHFCKITNKRNEVSR